MCNAARFKSFLPFCPQLIILTSCYCVKKTFYMTQYAVALGYHGSLNSHADFLNSILKIYLSHFSSMKKSQWSLRLPSFHGTTTAINVISWRQYSITYHSRSQVNSGVPKDVLEAVYWVLQSSGHIAIDKTKPNSKQWRTI